MIYIRETDDFNDGSYSVKITGEGEPDTAIITETMITLMIRGTDNPIEAGARLTGLVDQVVQELTPASSKHSDVDQVSADAP